MDDYLSKVVIQINKIKVEANEKLKRKALFDCGINFFDLEKTRGDEDEAKRFGAAQFKRASEKS
jgi:hypothetical protein